MSYSFIDGQAGNEPSHRIKIVKKEKHGRCVCVLYAALLLLSDSLKKSNKETGKQMASHLVTVNSVICIMKYAFIFLADIHIL